MANNLPRGYTQLEYIESSGTQYINTGFNPNQNTRLVMDIQGISPGTYSYFGSRNATGTGAFILWMMTETSLRSDYGSASVTQNVTSSIQRVVIDKNKNVTTYGTYTITNQASAFTCNFPILILSQNTGGEVDSRKLSARLYSCQIYDNGNLVRNFVPVTNNDNVVGLYDLVNGQFYGNSGTGTFVAGPVVETLEINAPTDLGSISGTYTFNYAVTSSNESQEITVTEYIDNSVHRTYTTESGIQQTFTIDTSQLSIGPHTYSITAETENVTETSSGTFEKSSNLITISGLNSDYGNRKKSFLIKFYVNDTLNSPSFNVNVYIDNNSIYTSTVQPAEVVTLQIHPKQYSEGGHTITVTAQSTLEGALSVNSYFFADLDRLAYLRRNQRQLRAKINLLNYNMQVVDEISGDVVDGNVAVDANSDIRRTCDLTLVAVGSKYNIEPESRIWLNRYVQIYIGVDDIYDDTTQWFNMGIYIIDQPSFNFDATTRTLTFQGLDLMSKMTGQRNGYLEGIPTVIPQDSSIRESMISTVTQLGGFSKYIIEDNPQPVPYDIQVDPGGTVYDLLVALRDILPSWQIYFDVDGVYHYDEIPNGQSEPIMYDDSTFKNLVITEGFNTDFSYVKNVVEVWGKTLEPGHYGDATVNGSVYNVSIADVSRYGNNIMYGFTAPSIVTNPQLQINSLGAKAVVNEDGSAWVVPEADTYYVVKYRQEQDNFLFMGYSQPYAIAEDDNPDSPFYVDGPVGKIRIVLQGGEYDNIYTNDLAQQRADYELWKRTRLEDNITLTMAPIYDLDVNTVVEYTPINQTEPQTYIIKNINTNLSYAGTQTVQMIKYYPLYPDI